MIEIICAFITGKLIILSMVINSNLSRYIGVFRGTLVNYVTGFVFTAVILSAMNISLMKGIGSIPGVPVWAFAGGLLGVIVVAAANVVIPHVPAVYMTLLLYSGQLGTGIVLDYLSSGSAPKGKIIGVLCIVAGMLYNSYLDTINQRKAELSEGCST